ncbi:MAG: Holliday junction ATP-dependent DNA helicase RuvA [Planctomycetota bacterium]|nr:MAG: Holliday junction ATP-dependent DNA helicase RuvA [Planctomycetota bacterium]
MFDFLTGVVVENGPGEVVLQVNGAGYRLAVSAHTAGRLPALGNEATLHVYHLLRDDRLQFYGFLGRAERALFERLLAVSKVGPTLALALLSALEPGALASAVDNGDVSALSKVKGVGKRTAERLCVELKDRLGPTVAELPRSELRDRGAAVAAALVSLGYPRSRAADVAQAVVDESEKDASLEVLVKRALGHAGSA